MAEKDREVPLQKKEKEPYWYNPIEDSGDLDDLIFKGEYIKPRSEK